MAFTLEQYLALEAAIAEGVTTVTWGGAGQTKTVTYRSLTELIRIYNLIGQALGLRSGTPKQTYACFTKGYKYASAPGVGSFCDCCCGGCADGCGCGCHG